MLKENYETSVPYTSTSFYRVFRQLQGRSDMGDRPSETEKNRRYLSGRGLAFTEGPIHTSLQLKFMKWYFLVYNLLKI